MTVSVLRFAKTGDIAKEDEAPSEFVTSAETSLTRFLTEKAQTFELVLSHATGSEAPIEGLVAAPTSRTYPHLFDGDSADGAAVTYVARAHNDARAALAGYDEGDIAEIGSRLAQIAVALTKARELATFNQSFGTACTFVRRAALASAGDEVTRGALNSLVQALSRLKESPMMTLSEAADIADEMSAEGWNGENPEVQRLVDIWISEMIETAPEEKQNKSEPAN